MGYDTEVAGGSKGWRSRDRIDSEEKDAPSYDSVLLHSQTDGNLRLCDATQGTLGEDLRLKRMCRGHY